MSIHQLQRRLAKFLWPKVELGCIVCYLIAKIQFFTLKFACFFQRRYKGNWTKELLRRILEWLPS
uniref:Uncharacterized protein n=1 Tax=Meloidogyne incognita TaxID=6306 RepID=A0A914MHZ5_MELIC